GADSGRQGPGRRRQHHLPAGQDRGTAMVQEHFQQVVFRRPAMAKLYLKSGDSVLKEVMLSQATTTIGRLPDNSLQIDNLAVSGHHAKIYWNDGHYVIEDLGSLNGI